MNKLLGVGLTALLALVLAACGTSQPAGNGPSLVSATITEAIPTLVQGDPLKTAEIAITIRVTNNTKGNMWLLGGDFHYRTDPGGAPIGKPSVFAGNTGSMTGNTSSCSQGPVGPGRSQTCTAIFYLGDYYPLTEVVPGVIRWSDRSGYSTRGTHGSLAVPDWVRR